MENGAESGYTRLDIRLLKKLRKENGLSQDKLALNCAKRHLRVSLASIKRAEAGQQVLYRTAAELAAYYSIPIYDLLDETLVEKAQQMTSLNPPTPKPGYMQCAKLTTLDLTPCLLIGVEFKDADKAISTSISIQQFYEHSDYSDCFLRLLVKSQSTCFSLNHHLLPLFIIFNRLVCKDTRLLIRVISELKEEKQQEIAFTQVSIWDYFELADWAEIQKALTDIDWGEIIFQDDLILIKI